MRRSSFFQRQLLVSLLATIVLVFAGFAVSFFVMNDRFERSETNPLLFYSRLLEGLAPEVPIERSLGLLSPSDRRPQAASLFLLDDHLAIVAHSRDAEEFDRFPLSVEDLPAEPGRVVRLRRGKLDRFGPGPLIVRLRAERPLYLLFQPAPGRKPGPPFMSTLVLYVGASALLSALLSFSILVYYLRKNALIIQDVIARIHKGDLKARFPVKRLDEIGQLMSRFNEMADEIERLVARVRQTERVRVDILEQLGHDLRTPLASLRNSIETLDERASALTPAQRRDLFEISGKEIHYVGRLVEDLLFLARVEDPRYLNHGSRLDLGRWLESEIETATAHASPGLRLTLENQLPADFRFFGDDHQLGRFVRNAVDNAIAHARHEVRVRAELDPAGTTLRLIVEDDGPGFTDEVLTNFGTKQFSRRFAVERTGKISLGLGSVIMRTVAEAHQGTIEVANLAGADGAAHGARVMVHLPLRA
jgi:signal transduction histidine kinase